MPKKQLELAKQVIKHQITGLDLIEMNEKNLCEIGIQTIHERKSIIRQVKILKNSATSTYGQICVKFQDGTNHKTYQLKLKISDKVKVKHVLTQALQTFKQKKIDLTQFALIHNQPQHSFVILSNNTILSDLINPYKIDEFLIIKSNDLTADASTQPNSVSSPIRIQREGIAESSLERIIYSPAQTIYIQPIDDNDNDEVIQLNTSGSESQIKTSRQNHRKNSKSSSKQYHQSTLKANKKQRPTQQSINTILSTNRENISNQSNASNYLQNYITSNRQSHKKQLLTNSQFTVLNNFQMKKHSVNDTAFNYNGSQQIQSLNNNFQATQILSNATNTNPMAQSSLSRGNSIKKMKTFSSGSAQSSHKQQQMQNLHQQQQSHINSGGITVAINKHNKKINHKGGIKNINMYSTMNGGQSSAMHPQNQALKKLKQREQAAAIIKDQQDTLSEEFLKSLNEGLIETQRIEYNVDDIQRNNIQQNSLNKVSHGAYKQSFASNQEQTQKKSDNQKINNLNDIFSDFLDEQSQVQPQNSHKIKPNQKLRAESLHSRQQVLLEEDSLENTKKYPDTYQVYLQTEGQQYFQNQDSNVLIGNLSNNQLGAQRAVKHMSHKSMYALNSNQLKSNHTSKKSVFANNCVQKQNLPQYYGTFDNSQTTPYNQYTMTVMSDCGGQYDNILLNENYNISNININNHIANTNNNNNNQSQHHYQNNNNHHTNHKKINHQRLNTDIDIESIKENINSQQNDNAAFEGLTGKRSGTMGNIGGAPYGRSDSNPAKHRRPMR